MDLPEKAVGKLRRVLAWIATNEFSAFPLAICVEITREFNLLIIEIQMEAADKKGSWL
jgi:hypothetical protein